MLIYIVVMAGAQSDKIVFVIAGVLVKIVTKGGRK